MHQQPPQPVHLSAEQLAAHLERRLDGSERRAVVAHLVACAECRREFAAVGRLVGTPRRSWRGIATALTLAAAAGLVFAVAPRSLSLDTRPMADTPTQRVSGPDVTPVIATTSPADGERLTSRPVALIWRGAGADALYRVTLQNAAGAVVWRTDTNDTTASVPASAPLTDGQRYYWFVDALYADGRSARSRASSFRP